MSQMRERIFVSLQKSETGHEKTSPYLNELISETVTNNLGGGGVYLLMLRRIGGKNISKDLGSLEDGKLFTTPGRKVKPCRPDN